MANIISELLKFGTSFDEPYNTLTGKRVSGGSKYNPDSPATKTSTLAGGFTNAITQIIASDIGASDKIAIGKCGDSTSISEYHSSSDENVYEIVSYDEESGEIHCSVYNTTTATGEKYELTEKNGNSIHCALFPTYYSDDEFSEYYDKLKELAKAGYPNRTEASELMGVLNDNVYRRLKDDTLATHIKIEEPSGTKKVFPLIRNAAFTSGTYDPDVVMIGNFELLKGNSTSKTSSGIPLKPKYSKEDLVGKFPINPTRVFTEEEKMMMQAEKLDDYYIVDETDLKICRIIQATSDTNIPFRVFTFRGDAGTGKSAKSKAVANGINLPIVRYTCSSNSEIFDFIGQVMPDTSKKKSLGEACDDALLAKLEELGGITFDNISKALNYPSILDIQFDPVMAYEDMTGLTVDITGEGDDEEFSVGGNKIGGLKEMTSYALEYWQKEMYAKFDQIIASVRKSYGEDTKFIYTETDFIRAIKYGWVVEIQEPNVILSEGVLVGLNGLLAEGLITLPTGETIRRHPDCVIIFTTNVTYNGCRAMNQSVIDRSNKVYDIEAPSVEIMAERAISISGNTNESDVLEMAQIVKDIAAEMVSSGIDDGVCGMRSLANWALSSRFEDPYEAFNECVLSKTSMDKDCRLSLKKRIDESKFKPVRRTRSI